LRAEEKLLKEGENAFHPLLAATYLSCIVEPVISSLGSGSFRYQVKSV